MWKYMVTTISHLRIHFRSLLSVAPPQQLQGMMLRPQKYNYEVRYKHDENIIMYLANILSRAYLLTTAHPSGAEFEHQHSI